MRLGVVLTLLLRLIYLLRFGWDPMWANAVYLSQARSLVVPPVRVWGPPAPVGLLFGGRAIGLSAIHSLELVYLIAHLLFTVGVIGIARGLWPARSRLTDGALVVLVAALPIIAGYSGYEDIGAMLGAGLFACTFALAIGVAAASWSGWTWREGGLIALALLSAATRTEGLAGLIGLAIGLALYGWRDHESLPRARRAASLLGLGTAGALLSTLVFHRLSMGRFELNEPTYAFYTFFVGLPPALCADRCIGEYGPYAESARRFGTFAANHGSLFRAAAAHPGELLLRCVYKVYEWAQKLADWDVVGPLPLALFVIGCWPGAKSKERRRDWLLLAYLGPALVLLAPPAVPMYLIFALPPVLLLAARGAARILDGRPRWIAGLAGVLAIGFGTAWAAKYGDPGPSMSRVSHPTAEYLERRCPDGCLVNYPPPHVTAETWKDLGAGAPLPTRLQTDEDYVFHRYPAAFIDGCRFRDRVARARAAGSRAPILYLEVEVESALAYSDLGFDAEHDVEGKVDLSHATLETTLADGNDRIKVWSFPDGVWP